MVTRTGQTKREREAAKVERDTARGQILREVSERGGEVVDAGKALVLVPMRMEEISALQAMSEGGMETLDKATATRARWVLERVAKLWQTCAEARAQSGTVEE